MEGNETFEGEEAILSHELFFVEATRTRITHTWHRHHHHQQKQQNREKRINDETYKSIGIITKNRITTTCNNEEENSTNKRTSTYLLRSLSSVWVSPSKVTHTHTHTHGSSVALQRVTFLPCSNGLIYNCQSTVSWLSASQYLLCLWREWVCICALSRFLPHSPALTALSGWLRIIVQDCVVWVRMWR